jgi:hypothetical protein
MSLSALAFLNPWLLAALATLPLIYWLLRTVPPRPRQIAFPPTRILVGIENKEKTPAKTPWWLLLIRLLAAALVIFALAEPVLNPQSASAIRGNGPVVIAVDNGWSSGSTWAERLAMVDRLIDEAEGESRPVAVFGTAATTKAPVVKLEAPADARATAAALEPQPFAPDRAALAPALDSALKTASATAASVVWLTDGIDHDGKAAAFAEALAKSAGEGSFALVDATAGDEPLGVSASVGADGKLTARIVRAGGSAREGIVHAYSAKGQRLGETPFKLGAGETVATAAIELPLELRNQVTRLEIAGTRSAGSVSLLDQRSQWQRVGLISGEAQEKAQPLLAPLYYIQRAVQPFSELIVPKEKNLASSIRKIIDDRASIMMLADIGTISGEAAETVSRWVEKGGVLVRFAGPRLEKGGDDLLPIGLRVGGRTLGGALSWSTPQPLAPFEEQSIFAGLTVPADVTVKRQVLADPALLTPEVKVWARLNDGTPLVTATRKGEGTLVLFHVTANSDWSNLPMSGLFVEMLRRVTEMGTLTAAPAVEGGDASAVADTGETVAAAPVGETLAPTQTLNGFGSLKPPPPTAQPIKRSEADKTRASLEHPPGYYGSGGTPRAINVIAPTATLAALPDPPAGTVRIGYDKEGTTPLKPAILLVALGLLFIDILAVLALMGGLRALWRPAAQAAAVVAAVLVALPAPPASAQDFDLPSRFTFPGRAPAGKPVDTVPAEVAPADQGSVAATSAVTFGYVLTGDPEVDTVSRQGLSGLMKVLRARTAVEPGEPRAVDIAKDEIAFYPVLYWPVLDTADPLPEDALAKIDAFMKQGGMIIFDTRDYGSGLPTGMAMAGERGPALQRLIGRLDIPRLEPVPEDHVLTKSFYLLQAFPGRWDGGQLWVEAQERDEDGARDERKARQADGVSSILVTPNDFASAWALDESGTPIYPVVPGGERQREMALRTGVNIVMHALTGNYKADQVHVPALLERLGN